MPTIKLTTGGSAVVLKSGKPSCTCCGVCSPDVTTVYVEYIEDPFGAATVYYFEMTGSLNDGNFSTLTGPFGECFLTWDGVEWYFEDVAFSILGADPPATTRCDPQGNYPPPASPPWDYSVTVSFNPLP